MSGGVQEALRAVDGLTLRCEEPLARHGSLRLGGAVEFYAVAHSDKALLGAVGLSRRHKIRLAVFCGFSDLAGRSEGAGGLLVRLGPRYSRIEHIDGQLVAGVGVPLARLGVFGGQVGFVDYDRLARMPGTVGEWLSGEGLSVFGEALLGVRVLIGKSIRAYSRDVFDTIPKRAVPLFVTLTDGLPLSAQAPAPRGALVLGGAKVSEGMARAGLLGLRLRQLRLSPRCPGVVINLGAAAPRDLDLLRGLVRDRLGRELDQVPALRLDLASTFRSAALRIGGAA